MIRSMLSSLGHDDGPIWRHDRIEQGGRGWACDGTRAVACEERGGLAPPRCRSVADLAQDEAAGQPGGVTAIFQHVEQQGT